MLLILVGLLSLVGFATAQFCELIYDGGVSKYMCSLLLELDSTAFPKIKDRLLLGMTSSALWRNYIGCWKIKDDSLFLDSILVCQGSDKYRPIVIDDIYATNKTPSGYFANWVSDSLRVVSGGIIKYVHLGWASKWENEEFIEVENGIVKNRRCYNTRVVNKGIREDQISDSLHSHELVSQAKGISLQFGRISAYRIHGISVQNYRLHKFKRLQYSE